MNRATTEVAARKIVCELQEYFLRQVFRYLNQSDASTASVEQLWTDTFVLPKSPTLEAWLVQGIALFDKAIGALDVRTDDQLHDLECLARYYRSLAPLESDRLLPWISDVPDLFVDSLQSLGLTSSTRWQTLKMTMFDGHGTGDMTEFRAAFEIEGPLGSYLRNYWSVQGGYLSYENGVDRTTHFLESAA